MGNEARKEVLDVSSMEQLLVFARRARRRRRLIVVIKVCFGVAVGLGLACGGYELYSRLRS